MRLIDADKLRIKCHTVNDLQPDKFVVTRMMVSSEAIDAEPTVKAIPVEWLKTQIEKCQEISNISKTVGLAILAETIKQWEKENE